MSEKGLTNISLKKINKSKVYQYIYRKKTTSKLQIVQELQMGLSTVSQNLNLLEQEGLIEKNGFFESTGGRKANALQIVSDFKISIGIGILKGMFHITAVDLYGNAFYTDTIPLPYSNTPDYYKQVTDAVKEFISSRQYDNNKVLGISIATQGITSPDHTTVLYGDIMNNAGMKLDDFSKYLPYPCYLEHDSKSAAFLELWNHPGLDSAVIILLNRNLGGGIITNHQIHQGISMHSGTLEHICINPDGPLCYCGSRGCLDVEADPLALLTAAGRDPGPELSLLQQANDLIRDHYDDPAVRTAAEALIDRLGLGLAGLVNILNPDRVILGGLHSTLLDADPARLRAVVAERSLWGQSGGVPILSCTLAHNSLVGAAELAWQPVLDDPLGTLTRD